MLYVTNTNTNSMPARTMPGMRYKMAYTTMYELLPALAKNETRTLTIFDNNVYNLPPGDYGLVEMYCNDKGCDCRRVFFNVMSSVTRDSVAVIAYGWESRGYYAKWYCGDWLDVSELNGEILDTVKSLKGPCLNLMSPQSKIAPLVLKMVSEFLEHDKAYIDRLKRHYKLFRAKVDAMYAHA